MVRVDGLLACSLAEGSVLMMAFTYGSMLAVQVPAVELQLDASPVMWA